MIRPRPLSRSNARWVPSPAILPLLALTMAAGRGGVAAAQEIPEDRLARFREHMAFGSLVKGGSVSARWLGDGQSFWYADGAPANTVIFRVDPGRGTRQPLFDTERLRAALAAVLGHTPPYDGLPFSEITLDEAASTADFEVEGRRFRVDLDTYEITGLAGRTPAEIARTTPQPVDDIWPATSGTAMEVPSPNGAWFLRHRDNDLWLRSSEDGRVVRVTEDGEDRYAWSSAGARWSPDEYRFTAQRTRTEGVHRVPVVHWLGPVEEVEWQEYPYTGGPWPQPELYVVDVNGRRPVPVDLQTDEEIGIHVIGFTPDGSRLLFQRVNRPMTRLDLMEADPATGESRIILTERQETYIEGLRLLEVQGSFYTPVDDDRFLWLSERDGFTHLYLYRNDGDLVRRLTSGPFPTGPVAAVDAEAGWVYFRAQRDPARPYDIHLYRVGLEGGDVQQLTEASGQHTIQFSPSKAFFVDTHSSVDRPPRSELRAADGTLVETLSTADVSALDAIDWRPPEEFVVKADDGVTDLHGVIYHPPDFDPSGRYPMVEIMYPGSQTTAVPRTFVPNGWGLQAQALAQLGFVTFIVDARGQPGRGKAFQDVVYKAIGRNEIPDHVATIRQLGEARPYMDLSRVGVHGYSWGGYFTLRAMLLAPEVYHVGVSGSPVVELESVAWVPVEPYMLKPSENPEGYAYASNLTIADRLAGKLLITIGTADVNTPFAQTMRMAEALIRADKPFDLLVLPDQSHGLQGRSMTYFQDAVARYFVEHLEPLRSPASSSP
ncbi:MAG: DPP IV N-terminal domain-containing protein [Gemmatimonadota bacterium]|nr:DPP IV N-terminal domain-containing protein [Gemmatimonadota bacterium]